eukprot:scaffold117196_cov45-Phaeocystis_antarctica.AAC.1
MPHHCTYTSTYPHIHTHHTSTHPARLHTPAHIHAPTLLNNACLKSVSQSVPPDQWPRTMLISHACAAALQGAAPGGDAGRASAQHHPKAPMLPRPEGSARRSAGVQGRLSVGAAATSGLDDGGLAAYRAHAATRA